MKKQEESNPFLLDCAKNAPVNMPVCVVCWEVNYACLQEHHPNGRQVYPNSTVTLCASCHAVYTRGGGLQELQERRDRLLEVNKAFYEVFTEGLQDQDTGQPE